MNEYGGGDGGGIVALVIGVIYLAILVVFIASGWKVFSKAGEAGWQIFIPIWNAVVWLRIAGRPWWWLLLMFIPIINFILVIMATLSFAERFGKGAGFAIGLLFLPIIFYPWLAFGDAQYQPRTA